jgi:hypothetical protein
MLWLAGERSRSRAGSRNPDHRLKGGFCGAPAQGGRTEPAPFFKTRKRGKRGSSRLSPIFPIFSQYFPSVPNIFNIFQYFKSRTQTIRIASLFAQFAKGGHDAACSATSDSSENLIGQTASYPPLQKTQGRGTRHRAHVGDSKPGPLARQATLLGRRSCWAKRAASVSAPLFGFRAEKETAAAIRTQSMIPNANRP